MELIARKRKSINGVLYLQPHSKWRKRLVNLGFHWGLTNVGIAIINHPPNHHKWVV